MRVYWELARNKVEAMSLRERIMLFSIVALLLIFLINAFLLDPLLVRQKAISAKLVQQEQETRALQLAIQNILQSRTENAHSPTRDRIAALKLQLQESEAYLQSRRDKLLSPAKMAGLLEQVLQRNDKLQLLELKTLPLSLLAEPSASGKASDKAAQKIYKHGVQITVRGEYLDLLRYLVALEKLPEQMFWGEINLTVEKHPDSVMTVTVYTLSLDKVWLTV
jgi:MSHA biogenesis protein MshJ